ncbi:MAG: hypothetical protein KDI09_20320, partial [Halioglobus sp.]|nr:hypothetical protein [Halioglobus sp.]
MAIADTEFVLRPQLTKEQAWEVVEDRVPHLHRKTASLTHHPFSGFVHLVRHPGLQTAADNTVHTLV